MEIDQAWLELELGTVSQRSEPVAPVRGRAAWGVLEVEADHAGGAACVRLAGSRRGGGRRVLAEVALELPVDGQLDLNISVGARGLLVCTLTDPDDDEGTTARTIGSSPFVQPGDDGPLAGVRLHAIVGSEPLLFSDSLGPAHPTSEPLQARAGLDAKLVELLAEFFALESTQTFASLALQNVAVGLRANASISPFAKPRLPRSPHRHLPKRWSVSGAQLALGSPHSLRLRGRSKRQTWHMSDETEGVFGHSRHDALRSPRDSQPLAYTPATARGRLERGPGDGWTPETGGRLRSHERGEARGFSALKSELVSSARELRRRFAAGSRAPHNDEADFATFWLPLETPVRAARTAAARPGGAEESGGEVSKAPHATAELPSGEMVSIDEVLARSAARAQPAGAARDAQPAGAARDAPEQPRGVDESLAAGTPSLGVPQLLDAARIRRRSSVMASGSSDELLAQRVRAAFATRNGAVQAPPPGAEGAASLEYHDFLRMCREVLELPQYVAHAVFDEITTLTVHHAVSLRACEAFFGTLRAEADETRRVFHALLGPQRALPGETLSRTVYAEGARARLAGDAADDASAPTPASREVSAKRLELVVRGVLGLHPGLQLLKGHDEFREAYVETVTTRILFAVAGAGRNSIPWSRWRASELTECLFALHDQSDINKSADFFSYNDFYVVWCLFSELDEDEDSRLGADDLLRYNQYSLSHRAVSRVLALSSRAHRQGKASEATSAGEGDARGGEAQPDGPCLRSTMVYADFVRFILAEEVRMRAACSGVRVSRAQRATAEMRAARRHATRAG